jgi:23S rRNA pseudouridine2605 synthase
MSEERIQKILARAGVASRRKAEELIEQGLVTVNGKVAGLGDKADPERDAIKVDGKRVQPASQEHRYLLLNKPKEVMSTVSDPEGRKTVLDFVPPGMRKALVPVGRLDYNTEGLLLLTDDGDFAQRIAHPRYGSTKTYEVKVKGTPPEPQLDRLRNGVMIEGRRTAPAKITPRNPFKPLGGRRRGEPESDNSWWIVEITEGRTRQIREMFFQIGHPVQKLRRVAIGPLRDPELPLGALRELSEQEVRKLLRSARAPEEKRQERKPAPRKAVPAKKTAPKRAAAKKVVPVRKAARKPKGGR